MAQFGVTAEGATLSPARGLAPEQLSAALGDLPARAPLAILIHGYRFDPFTPAHDPHAKILSPEGSAWPAALGFSPDGRADGLSIGFGWDARAPHLPELLKRGRTGFAAVYDRAAAAGRALADLIEHLAFERPGHPVDLVAHSLGARVALSALPHLSPAAARSVGRIILLGAAEYAGRAAAAFAAAPEARPEVYSVTARINDVFDCLFETFAPEGEGADHVLSRGLPPLRRAITLQIDSPRTRSWAAGRGIILGTPERRVCHWGFYSLPGAMTLYARILREREVWSVAALAQVPALAEQDPRWSSLPGLPPVPRLPRLPFSRPRSS